jgi:alpha,alpha-trehalose phosphorylase
MALVYGFGGMRDHDLTSLEFCPRLPAIWSRLRFPLTWRGRRIEVELTPGRASYRLLEGEALTFRHEGEELELTPENPVAERSAIRCENHENPSEHG